MEFVYILMLGLTLEQDYGYALWSSKPPTLFPNHPQRSTVVQGYGGPRLTIEELAANHCVPCNGTRPMSQSDAEQVLRVLPGWLLGDRLIEKEFRFGSYRHGLEFTYRIGRIADEQDHHPDMIIRWRRVKIAFTTHVIRGLSMNDFIMAARAELEYQKYSSR